MSAATAQLFEALSNRGSDPLLAKAHGTVRFDIVKGRVTESWLVRIDKGNIKVSRGAGPADTVFRGSRELFADLATGKENAFAARLRGAIGVEGDMRLAVLFQRILPNPQSSERGPAGRSGRSR
ncbi:MAG TPA: SCP2 sterol-binding domain-containing protein [Gaiellaceae bacterium]